MIRISSIQWVACLSLMVCLAACSKKEYTQMIPKDAALVVSADPQALIRGVGGAEELKKLAARTDNALLKSVLSSPQETGVDVAEKMYLFASLNRDEPTLLMKLEKVDALEKWLEKMTEGGLCGKMQRRGDFTWAFFSGQGYCAFTDEVVMWVYAPLLPVETVLNRLAQLVKQKPEDSFVATGPYTRFAEIKDHVAFYLSLSTLPNASEVSAVLGLPSSVSAEDLRLMGGVSLTKEKASLHADYYSENKELEEFLKEQGSEAHALSKRYFEYLPEDVLACVALKVDGDAYSKIGTLPGAGDILDGLTHFVGIDSEKFLNSLKGDFTMGLKSTGYFPQLMCFAGAPDGVTKEVLREGLKPNSSFLASSIVTVSPDNYGLFMRELGSFGFGVQKESFYLLTGLEKPYSLVKAERPLSKSSFEGMKGKLISYVLVNLSEREAVEKLTREFAGDKLALFRQVKAVELMVRPGNRLELNVYLLPV